MITKGQVLTHVMSLVDRVTIYRPKRLVLHLAIGNFVRSGLITKDSLQNVVTNFDIVLHMLDLTYGDL